MCELLLEELEYIPIVDIYRPKCVEEENKGRLIGYDVREDESGKTSQEAV